MCHLLKNFIDKKFQPRKTRKRKRNGNKKTLQVRLPMRMKATKRRKKIRKRKRKLRKKSKTLSETNYSNSIKFLDFFLFRDERLEADANEEHEEGEIDDEDVHPMVKITKIDPKDIPEVSNKFLMRGGSGNETAKDDKEGNVKDKDKERDRRRDNKDRDKDKDRDRDRRDSRNR